MQVEICPEGNARAVRHRAVPERIRSGAAAGLDASLGWRRGQVRLVGKAGLPRVGHGVGFAVAVKRFWGLVCRGLYFVGGLGLFYY